MLEMFERIPRVAKWMPQKGYTIRVKDTVGSSVAIWTVTFTGVFRTLQSDSSEIVHKL